MDRPITTLFMLMSVDGKSVRAQQMNQMWTKTFLKSQESAKDYINITKLNKRQICGH